MLQAVALEGASEDVLKDAVKDAQIARFSLRLQITVDSMEGLQLRFASMHIHTSLITLASNKIRIERGQTEAAQCIQ